MLARRGSPKRWFGTSYRSVTPAETLARFEPFAPALGITRIADLTGLDYLGIPVFAAMRPNARSLSVHQGKGLDSASARASAFMEAAEFDHAERIAARSLIFARNAPPSGVVTVDPDLLPRYGHLPSNKPVAWLPGRDLMTAKRMLVPRALVAIDFTRRPDGCFIESTSGLASGNSMAEAVLSGLFELVERDATSLWRLRSARQRAGRRVALGTIARGRGNTLLVRLRDARIAVAVWDTTTDIGIASFVCRIREDGRNARSAFGAFWGAGCHLSRDVALCRAVTEAVQTRLTYISGARDDLLRHDYGQATGEALFDAVFDLWEEREGGRSFRDVPDCATRSIDEDTSLTLGRLKIAGIAHAVAVDLTRDEIGLPVARMIVPGLEPDHHRGAHRPGARARVIARAAARGAAP